MRGVFSGRSLGRRIIGTGCAVVCVGCAAAAFWEWAGQTGSDIPPFSIGPVAASVEVDASAAASSANQEHPLLLADDGIAPFHEDALPGVTATPEPGRAWHAVEEREINGGEAVDNFFVKDSTGSGTDLAWELTQEPAAQLRGDGSVEVLIYHTHTSEAYSEAYTGFYYDDMTLRTQNQDMNVVAAGEALKRSLEAYGIGVVHDTTVCDAIYNGSYSRSWDVIQNNLAAHPGIQITIDVHRDSMTTESGVKYKPTVAVDGRKAAQVMMIAGCNADGSWEDFPNWEENLRLMLRIQQKMQELYPGLARPLNFSDSRYNMNATPGSILLEIGTEVNTVSEAEYAAKLFGQSLAEVFLG